MQYCMQYSRSLFALWFDTSNHDKPFYVNKKSKNEIDKDLKQIFPPDYITRKPRSIRDMSFWKASEIGYFILLYSPILLKKRLPEKYYQHYLLLVYATRLLLQNKVSNQEIDLAENLLHLYVRQFENLYGLKNCSFNVHQLLHMANYVRL